MGSHKSQIVRHCIGVGWQPVFHHQKSSLKWGVGCPILQVGHHLSQTFNHHSLDGCAQFPPTVLQPEGLAARYIGGQVEVHCKIWLGIQIVWHLDVLPQHRGWWHSIQRHPQWNIPSVWCELIHIWVLLPLYSGAKRYKGFPRCIKQCLWCVHWNCHLISCIRRNNRWMIHINDNSLPSDARTKLFQAL